MVGSSLEPSEKLSLQIHWPISYRHPSKGRERGRPMAAATPKTPSDAQPTSENITYEATLNAAASASRFPAGAFLDYAGLKKILEALAEMYATGDRAAEGLRTRRCSRPRTRSVTHRQRQGASRRGRTRRSLCGKPVRRARWLRRAVRNRHRHAIEQASCRWRGG